MDAPRLVAHRGYAAHYPENSLCAMREAVAAGARCLELDVQLSADRVPVLLHDADLQRVSGRPGRVHELEWSDLRHCSIGEPARFGQRFADEPLPALAELVCWLEGQPGVCLFVELKSESIEHFGADTVLQRVLAVLQPVLGRCALISFHAETLARARHYTRRPIGWVIRRWGLAARETAMALRPDYLICNHAKIDDALWPGPWQWFLYEITRPEQAWHWWRRGARWLESMDIATLLKDPRLAQEPCDGL